MEHVSSQPASNLEPYRVVPSCSIRPMDPMWIQVSAQRNKNLLAALISKASRKHDIVIHLSSGPQEYGPLTRIPKNHFLIAVGCGDVLWVCLPLQLQCKSVLKSLMSWKKGTEIYIGSQSVGTRQPSCIQMTRTSSVQEGEGGEFCLDLHKS